MVAGSFYGVDIGASDAGALGSFVWLIIAVGGALPVSWTYMSIGDRGDYNRSLVETMTLLPMIVTGVVIVVHNSIALAFSLAGIVAGVQFRNALKSLGDALFILLSTGTGLSAGSEQSNPHPWSRSRLTTAFSYYGGMIMASARTHNAIFAVGARARTPPRKNAKREKKIAAGDEVLDGPDENPALYLDTSRTS